MPVWAFLFHLLLARLCERLILLLIVWLCERLILLLIEWLWYRIPFGAVTLALVIEGDCDCMLCLSGIKIELMKVHSLLDSLGLSYIWSNQIHTIESCKRVVKQRLMDQFIQEWQSRVAENSVCSNYRSFNKKFCFEEYLTYLSSILRQRVLKFWVSNHRLPIQQRRSLGIPRDERICTVCDSGEVGDEFHYLFNCSNENVKRNRTKYVDK